MKYQNQHIPTMLTRASLFLFPPGSVSELNIYDIMTYSIHVITLKELHDGLV
jgi:hypothetical protein